MGLKILIQENTSIFSNEQRVYGIYEPASYGFNLNMWSETKAEDLRSSLNRLKKIELSKSSNEILEAILFSFSYPPQGMTEKEFVDLKINWMIEHDRINLIESFLKQNDQFDSKKKAVEYLVNKKIGDLMHAEQNATIDTFRLNNFKFREIFLNEINITIFRLTQKNSKKYKNMDLLF